ncbi:MAG: methyltransferase domain-containing protein [Pseudomonadota bacterium]|jgi:SAM-dependent methyltransferase|nr:MAG: SAM-dependent methyltransferase [Pseudomonadota bacterium]
MNPPAPAEWLGSPLGRQLLAAEAALLRGLLDDVFGLELLQLGTWGLSRELLSSSRTRRQTVIGTREDVCSGGEVDLVAELEALPVQTASVDAVLLPHTLEFAPDPHAIVREADRVLHGEGQLIVMGFRPVSLWGLRAAASRAGYPPGLKQMLGPGRVVDWLELLGYEIVQRKRYLYSRPWGLQRTDQRRILRRGLFNPMPAAAWLLCARKHVYRMTPLKLRFSQRERRPVFGSALPEPTRRHTS